MFAERARLFQVVDVFHVVDAVRPTALYCNAKNLKQVVEVGLLLAMVGDFHMARRRLAI